MGVREALFLMERTGIHWELAEQIKNAIEPFKKGQRAGGEARSHPATKGCDAHFTVPLLKCKVRAVPRKGAQATRPPAHLP